MSGGGAMGMNFSSLTSGAMTLLSGGYDLSKANKMEKRLGKRPLYSIPEPTYNNQYLAEERAQQGLSDEALQIYQQNADRGLSSSLDALLKSGGGVNSVSDLYANYSNNAAQIALLDDQAKFANQQMLMQQNSLMADEIDKAWQLNIFAPWADEKQKIAEKRTLGNAKKLAGASMIAGSSTGAGYKQPDNQEQQQANNAFQGTKYGYYSNNGQNPNGYFLNENVGQDAPYQYRNSNYILDNLYDDNYTNQFANQGVA